MNTRPLWVLSLAVIAANGCQFYLDRMYGGIFANCTRRNLSGMPTDLPVNTTSLDLRYNNISEMPRNVTFTLLKYLDISYNNFSRFNSGDFNGFQSLRELFIHNNNLTLGNISYPEDIFQPLQNLLKLHLHNNDKRIEGSYPEYVIGKLNSIEEIKIDTFSTIHFGFGFSKLFHLKTLLLGFEGCKLEHVQNRTFENLRNVSLNLIDLDFCPVAKLDKGSLLPLKNLKHFHMSYVQLEPSAAILAMYGFRWRNLSAIHMNNVFHQVDFRNLNVNKMTISNDIMVYIKDVCVETFTMTSNNLLWFGNEVLKETVFSNCIKYLDLSMNDLYGDVTCVFQLAMMPNLMYLNVSNHERRRSYSRFHKVQQSETSFGFTVPNTLKVLNLDGLNTVSSMSLKPTLHVYNARSLRHFSFAYNGFQEDLRVIGLENLTFFDISGNNCSSLSSKFYDDFPNLQSLSMENVNFGENYLLYYGERLFRPMRNLKKINLLNNKIRLLDPNIFTSNPVEAIIISQNRFESIPFDLVTTPYLSFLDLSFNSLAMLSAIEMKLLDNLAIRNNLTLNLEGNLLSCGCDNLDFILWLYNSKVQVIRVSTYICQMTDGNIANTSSIKNRYEEIWLSCNGRMSLSVSITLIAVFILVSLGMYFIVRKKTLLINIILRMFGYGPLSLTAGRDDFRNNAYIGYSDVDYQYICHSVRDHLENRHGLKLFIRDRDTIPGGQIADDIINGIESSWRTVLFLSASFLNDHWCQFTINRVVYSSANLPPGNVLLVIFDDVMRGDIDPTLLNVVDERDIFYLERYRDDEDRIWGQICERII